MTAKFQVGDRVEMTPETAKVNDLARSFTGVVVGYSSLYADQVRLRRDGLKTVEMWSEEAWQLRGSPSEVFEAAGAPC